MNACVTSCDICFTLELYRGIGCSGNSMLQMEEEPMMSRNASRGAWGRVVIT
jgi:hypothetical protein